MPVHRAAYFSTLLFSSHSTRFYSPVASLRDRDVERFLGRRVDLFLRRTAGLNKNKLLKVPEFYSCLIERKRKRGWDESLLLQRVLPGKIEKSAWGVSKTVAHGRIHKIVRISLVKTVTNAGFWARCSGTFVPESVDPGRDAKDVCSANLSLFTGGEYVIGATKRM